MASSSADAVPDDHIWTSWSSLFYRSHLTGCLVQRAGTHAHDARTRLFAALPPDSELKRRLTRLQRKAQAAESAFEWQVAVHFYEKCSMVLFESMWTEEVVPTGVLIAFNIWAALWSINLAHLKLKDYSNSIRYILNTMVICWNLVAGTPREVAFSFPVRSQDDPPMVGYEEPYPPEWEMGLMWHKLVILCDWRRALAESNQNTSGGDGEYQKALASIPHLRFPNKLEAEVEMELCSSLALMFKSDGQYQLALNWFRAKRQHLKSRLDHYLGRACQPDAPANAGEREGELKFQEIECFYDEMRTDMDEAAVYSDMENHIESLNLLRVLKPKLEDTVLMSDKHKVTFLLMVNEEILRLSAFSPNKDVPNEVADLKDEQQELTKHLAELGTDSSTSPGSIFSRQSEELIAANKFVEALTVLQSWHNRLKDGRNSRQYLVDAFMCSQSLAACELLIFDQEAELCALANPHQEAGKSEIYYSGLDPQWRWRSLKRLERACNLYDEVFSCVSERFHNINTAFAAFWLAEALFMLVLLSPNCPFLFNKNELPFLRQWLKGRVPDHTTTEFGCPICEKKYSRNGLSNYWSPCQHNPGWLYVVQILFRFQLDTSAEQVYKASSLDAGNQPMVISYNYQAFMAIQEVYHVMLYCAELIATRRGRPRNYSSHEVNLMRQQFIWAERGRARSLMYQLGPRVLSADSTRSLFDIDIDDNVVWDAIENSLKVCGEGTVFVIYSYIMFANQDGQSRLRSKVRPSNVYAYVLTQTGPPQMFKLPNVILHLNFARQIEVLYSLMSSKEMYNRMMGMTRDNETDEISTYLELMYEVLISPFAHLLPKEYHHKLVFAPAECLIAVPFALLRDPKTKEYLFQRHTISITPSLRVLGVCNNRLSMLKSYTTLREEGKSALVIGDAVYEPGRRLMGTITEMDAIVKLFGKEKVCTLQGTAATVEAVVNQVKELRQSGHVYGFIHFAVHGRWDGTTFAEGALELSHESDGSSSASKPSYSSQDVLTSSQVISKEGASSSSDTFVHDKSLATMLPDVHPSLLGTQETFTLEDSAPSASENTKEGSTIKIAPSKYYLHSSAIVENDWRTHIVVLSACNTSLGQGTGEGVANLPRAFAGAGVPSTVASYWEVNDISTPTFMAEFYTHLKRKDVDVASALRSAMICCLENGLQIYQWGAFAVWGLPTVCLPTGMQTS